MLIRIFTSLKKEVIYRLLDRNIKNYYKKILSFIIVIIYRVFYFIFEFLKINISYINSVFNSWYSINTKI